MRALFFVYGLLLLLGQNSWGYSGSEFDPVPIDKNTSTNEDSQKESTNLIDLFPNYPSTVDTARPKETFSTEIKVAPQDIAYQEAALRSAEEALMEWKKRKRQDKIHQLEERIADKKAKIAMLKDALEKQSKGVTLSQSDRRIMPLVTALDGTPLIYPDGALNLDTLPTSLKKMLLDLGWKEKAVDYLLDLNWDNEPNTKIKRLRIAYQNLHQASTSTKKVWISSENGWPLIYTDGSLYGNFKFVQAQLKKKGWPNRVLYQLDNVEKNDKPTAEKNAQRYIIIGVFLKDQRN